MTIILLSKGKIHVPLSPNSPCKQYGGSLYPKIYIRGICSDNYMLHYMQNTRQMFYNYCARQKCCSLYFLFAGNISLQQEKVENTTITYVDGNNTVTETVTNTTIINTMLTQVTQHALCCVRRCYLAVCLYFLLPQIKHKTTKNCLDLMSLEF